ncbi:MAG: DUF551 domain-containing protein [Bacteroidales bacterium]|nr:DUF551 domain-containing protein [Bacteroidales bacterium]
MEEFRPILKEYGKLLEEQRVEIEQLRGSLKDLSTYLRESKVSLGGWIRIADALPELEKSVLVCGCWKGVCKRDWWVAHRSADPLVVVDKYGFVNVGHFVITHWMPVELPEL